MAWTDYRDIQNACLGYSFVFIFVMLGSNPGPGVCRQMLCNAPPQTLHHELLTQLVRSRVGGCAGGPFERFLSVMSTVAINGMESRLQSHESTHLLWMWGVPRATGCESASWGKGPTECGQHWPTGHGQPGTKAPWHTQSRILSRYELLLPLSPEGIKSPLLHPLKVSSHQQF